MSPEAHRKSTPTNYCNNYNVLSMFQPQEFTHKTTVTAHVCPQQFLLYSSIWLRSSHIYAYFFVSHHA